jgi:hypothetical protein
MKAPFSGVWDFDFQLSVGFVNHTNVLKITLHGSVTKQSELGAGVGSRGELSPQGEDSHSYLWLFDQICAARNTLEPELLNGVIEREVNNL